MEESDRGEISVIYIPQKISDEQKYKCNMKSTFSQVLATLVESLLVAVLGSQNAMPTIVLGALYNKPQEKLCLDDYEAAWFGSILYLCQPLGSVASGFLCETFGRRGLMTLINLPFIAGWILLHYASSVAWLFAAALMMGIGIGFCEAPIAAYLGEICEPHLRGSLFSVMLAAASFGYLSSFVLGSIFDWRTFALVNVIYPVATMILLFQIPESPVWLIRKGRLCEAQKSLGWLRGFLQPHGVQEEYERLVKHIKCSEPSSSLRDGNPQSNQERKSDGILEKVKELKDPKLYLPLRLVVISFIFTQSTCMQAFRPYLINILTTFNFPVNENWVLVVIGCFCFFGSLMPIFIFRFTGKRTLLLSSQFICTVAILGLGFYNEFLNSVVDKGSVLRWLPVTLFAIIFFFSNMGIMNIPWMLMGEVFPVKWRSVATGVCGAWAYCVTSFAARTFLPLEKLLSLSGMFFLYGGIGAAGFLYFFLSLPETEGKSLDKIETYFTPYHEKKDKFSRPKKEGKL